MKSKPGVRTTVVALSLALMTTLSAGCAGAEATSAQPLSPETYSQMMTAWFETNWIGNFEEGQQVIFAEDHNPTQAELERLQEFADKLKASVPSFLAITPPAEIARVHQQFAADWAAEVDLLQQMVDAAKVGDWPAFDGAAGASMAVMNKDANTLAALGAYLDAHSAY